jgi:hypothetical protein
MVLPFSPEHPNLLSSYRRKRLSPPTTRIVHHAPRAEWQGKPVKPRTTSFGTTRHKLPKTAGAKPRVDDANRTEENKARNEEQQKKKRF